VREILGLRTVADSGTRFLVVDPCIPKSWPGFSATFRYGGSRFEISVENPRGVNRGVAHVNADGVDMPDLRVPLADDGAVHRVRVAMLGG
jgi:cyclic beta-1,2-glucan synthetase